MMYVNEKWIAWRRLVTRHVVLLGTDAQQHKDSLEEEAAEAQRRTAGDQAVSRSVCEPRCESANERRNGQHFSD